MATEPLSAIPWLSENPKDPKRPTPRRSGATTSPDAPIEITAIAPLEKEGVGILPPSTTGLPRNLWNGLSELRVRKLISDFPNTGVPTSRELFTRLLLAQTLPPAGSAGGDTLLIARIDRLIKGGRLAEADALARASGSISPELFARTFDIGLLNNEIDVVCKTLLSQPQQPNLAAQRIYCLGTSGQWRAAETALKSSTELSSAMVELLAGFLDPDSFENVKPPRGEPVQSALEFKIRDAIALPRRTTRPPLAFYYADLSGRAGLRQRILAAEALVSAGALPASVLFSAYRDSAPAASGGAWDRAAAVQDLDQGIAIGKWEQNLITAHARMRRLSLLPALADIYARALAGAPAPSSKDASQVRGLLLALGSAYQDPKGQNWPTRIAALDHKHLPEPKPPLQDLQDNFQKPSLPTACVN